jgi:hypothetical protein
MLKFSLSVSNFVGKFAAVRVHPRFRFSISAFSFSAFSAAHAR